MRDTDLWVRIFSKLVLKKSRWVQSINSLGEAYSVAYNSFKDTLGEQEAAYARQWSTLLTVLSVVSLGGAKLVMLGIPRTGSLPFPKLVSEANRKWIWQANDAMAQWANEPMNVLSRHLSITANNLKARTEDTNSSMLHKAARRKSVLGHPVAMPPHDPLQYLARLNKRVEMVWESAVQTTNQLLSDEPKEIPDSLANSWQSVVQNTLFWNEPDPAQFNVDTVGREMERCLWAMWVQGLKKRHTSPSISGGYYAGKTVSSRGRTREESHTYYKNPGSVVEKRLGQVLKVKINGKPVDEYMGMITTGAEVKELTAWGKQYLENHRQKFGNPLPTGMKLPWTS